jgi:hypothetical protein
MRQIIGRRRPLPPAAPARTVGLLAVTILCIAAGCFRRPTAAFGLLRASLQGGLLAQLSAGRSGTSNSGSGVSRSSGVQQLAKGFDPVGQVEAAAPSSPQDGVLKIKSLGGGAGSFLLNIGGQKILVNPVLTGDSPIMEPEKVHELVDYVVLTSPKEDFMHMDTIQRMNLMKVNFVADAKSGEKLERMMVRNLAILGPMGRTLLSSETDAAPIGVMIAPGADGPLPWSPPESAFLFVNLNTGLCVAYEAMGQFLGEDAKSSRDGIPEEAYMADYLITPNLRTAAGTCRGLADKGAQLRAVVRLPAPGAVPDDETISAAKEANPVLGAVLAFDRSIDSALGGIGDSSDEFLEFMKKQGEPLSKMRVLEPVVGGEFVDLETVGE